MHTVRNRKAAQLQPGGARSKADDKAGIRSRKVAKGDLPAKAAQVILLPALPPAFPPGLIIAPPAGPAIASVPWPAVELKRPEPAAKPAARKTVNKPARKSRASGPAAAQSPLPAPPSALMEPAPRRKPASRSAPGRPASPGTSRRAPAAPAPLPRNLSLTRQRGGGLFGALGEFLRYAGLLPARQKKKQAKPAANAEMARLRRENAALRRQLEALLALQSVGTPASP